ncbi:MAG TPA: hypothetical protein VG755_03315 [Nannocystaceae bacterium]|nr:hypothetical protein [Nannocystaceae bacterium]
MVAYAPPSAEHTIATRRPPKRPRLFGQWLIDQGAITQSDLREALALMRAVNSSIGELAVANGLVTAAQAEEINELQRHVDGRWGEIAIALGVGRSTAARIERLAWEQQLENLRLSDALVELDLMSATEVETRLAEFERGIEGDDAVLDDESQAWIDEIVDGLPRMLGRVLGSPARVATARAWDGTSYEHHAQTVITGPHGCTIALTVERGVARALADALDVPAERGANAMRLDAAVGAMLVLYGAHVARRLDAAHGPGHDARPPQSGTMLRGSHCVGLALADGAAMLVLTR